MSEKTMTTAGNLKGGQLMKTKSGLWWLITALLGSLMPRVCLALDGEQDESVLDCATASQPYQLVYGMHTINCALASGASIDTFQFQGSPGDIVRICCDGLSNNLDCNIELFAPTMGTQGSSLCSAGQFDSCSICANYVLPEPGTYTILFSDSGADNQGSYTLQLERIPPMSAPPVLPYGFTVILEPLNPTTDHDFFSFYGMMGSVVRFQANGRTNNLDLNLEFLDPGGTIFDSTLCSAGQFNTCSITYDVTLPATGIHYVIVSDSGKDNAGFYDLSATCISNCPTLSSTSINNGSGVNPSVYSPGRPLVPGACWTAEIDANSHPGAIATSVFVYALPSVGVSSSFGEILVDLSSSRLGRISAPVDMVTGISSYSAMVPNDPGLVGLSVATQGLIVGGGVQLTNAVNYGIGY